MHKPFIALILLWCTSIPAAAQNEKLSAKAWHIDELDCTALQFKLIDIGPDLITPAKIDARAELIAAFVKNPELTKRMSRAGSLDPSGLCHYRDANKQLVPTIKKSSFWWKNTTIKNRVVFIGDSITEGWLKASPEFFTGQIINRGIAGQNTTQLLNRFRYDVINLKPEVVHIMAGINDINLPSGTVLTFSNIVSMVELADANKIKVVLASITPSTKFLLFPKEKPAPQVVRLNQLLRDYAQENNVVYVDYYIPLLGLDGGISESFSNDGLHPNRLGYELMTPLAKSAINTALKN